MSLCGAWSVIAEGDDGETIVHPLACRSWNCPRCRKRNKRVLLYRLGSAKVTTLLTLTTNPAAHQSRDDAFRAGSLAVNRLFKRIRRRWPGARVEYFLIWERTTKGWPHAHLLLQAPFIPQRWLSHTWRRLTGARVVDIRPVHTNQGITSYLTKYLAKDPYVPRGMKRYRHSRRFFDYLLSQVPGGDGPSHTWRVVHQSPEELAFYLSRTGHTVRLDPDGSFVAWPNGHPHAPALDSVALHLEWTAGLG